MTVLDYASGILADTRSKAVQNVHDFGLEHPLLLSFLAVQILFASVPALLFTSFVVGVVCLALVSALLFFLFWVGVAAVVFGSTLCVTAAIAVLAWGYGVGVYAAARFVYGLVKKEKPDNKSGNGANGQVNGNKANGSKVNGHEDESHDDEEDNSRQTDARPIPTLNGET